MRIATIMLGTLVGTSTVTAAPVQDEARPVELAICLDTSGSMSGLIDAAKQKLWAIVNDLALAEPAPDLRVALLTYGNNGHEAENGWVRVDSGFTDDLDLISQKLFALTTDGGEEYVGRVLQHAGQLDWHPSTDALRLAVVAGNESADQDRQADFRAVCRQLIARGIMVNAIYCGAPTDDVAPTWREVATLADGHFATIDKDHGTVVIETPFDEELATLSAAMNATYLPFGAEGAAGWANQSDQDHNAASLNSAAAAQRASTKARHLYQCSWDLVDACSAGQVKLDEVPVESLPEAMQSMTPEERAAHVSAMAGKRTEIQGRIRELNDRRQAYVVEQMKKDAVDESRSFDHALRTAIRAQAEAKGFRFK